MFNFTYSQCRKGAVALVAVRLNMTLITGQHLFNLCTKFVTKSIFEHSYLLVATDA